MKLKIIILLFGLMLSLNLFADSLTLDHIGWTPKDGADLTAVDQVDYLFLDPAVDPDKAVTLTKPLDLEIAHGKSFDKMEVSALTTSTKRMRFKLICRNFKTNTETVLASKIMPTVVGLTFGPRKVTKKTNHTFNTKKNIYYLMVEFLDGAPADDSEDTILRYFAGRLTFS